MNGTLRPILSLLLGFFFLIVGHGLQITLLPLRAAAEGWSSFEIGVIGSAYYIGFVAGCFGAPYLIRHSGHIRAFTALVALISATMVTLPLLVVFPAWFFLRLLIGFSLAGLYMIIESWLNDRAVERQSRPDHVGLHHGQLRRAGDRPDHGDARLAADVHAVRHRHAHHVDRGDPAGADTAGAADADRDRAVSPAGALSRFARRASSVCAPPASPMARSGRSARWPPSARA